MRQITLNKNYRNTGALIVLSVEVATTNGIDNRIFVKQRRLLPDGTINDAFVGVASAAQLAALPPGAPTDEQRYFRTSAMTVTGTTLAHLQDVALTLEAEVSNLVQELIALDRAAEEAPEDPGPPGPVTSISGKNANGFSWSVVRPSTTPELSLTLLPGAVSLAQLAPSSSSSVLLGRGAAGAGNYEPIGLGAGLSVAGTTLSVTTFDTDTLASVEGEALVFSGASGKLGRRFTGNGVLKAVNGVLIPAVSGTDYVAPSALTAHTGNTANPHNVTKSQIGLALADNTADTDKIVSSAQQTALDLKANLASPALTGTPTAPTAVAGTNTAQLATTAFVKALVDLALTGVLELQGNLDCSANPNYPVASKGDTYYVTVAGKIGGASGVVVDIGDAVIARADNAGGTEAAVGTSWFVIEHNVVGALMSANNLSDLTSASIARGNLGLGTLATQSLTFGAGIPAALAVAVGSPGAPVLLNGAGGTPTSLGLVSATGLPLGTGVIGALPVANGGSGVATLTAYAPVFGGTTSTGAFQSGTTGTAGQALISNGAGALPTFQAGGTVFTSLSQTDANTVEEKNGVNAQTLNVYGTFTDTLNYERLKITQETYLGGKYFVIGAEALGTGTSRQNIVIRPNGSGSISAHRADGTAVGGNERGLGAVDFQTSRVHPLHVAVGANTFIGSGVRNYALSAESFIGSGENNSVNAIWAAVVGGRINKAYGIASFIGGGAFNDVNNQYSSVLGGYGNVVNGELACISGGYNNRAAGRFSIVGSGEANAASGSHSVIGGGFENQAEGPYATIGGGARNAANGKSSTVAGGYNNEARGEGSAALGGYASIAVAFGSEVSGLGALADKYGQQSRNSTNGWGTWGQQQREEYTLFVATTDATATQLRLDGVAASIHRLDLGNNVSWGFTARITGRTTTAGNNFFDTVINGLITRGATAGSTVLIGVNVVVSRHTTLGADLWVATATVDGVNGALALTVTGSAATNINWHADVRVNKTTNA